MMESITLGERKLRRNFVSRWGNLWRIRGKKTRSLLGRIKFSERLYEKSHRKLPSCEGNKEDKSLKKDGKNDGEEGCARA